MWLEALIRVDSACIQSHCAQRLVVAKVWCVWGEGGGDSLYLPAPESATCIHKLYNAWALLTWADCTMLEDGTLQLFPYILTLPLGREWTSLEWDLMGFCVRA